MEERTTFYRCRKTGQLKKRIEILIDYELAKKLFKESARLYGGRGVSRFIEELLYNYFSSKSSKASESSTASKTSSGTSESSTTHKASRSRRTEVYMSEEEREEIDRLMREVIRRYLSSSVG